MTTERVTLQEYESKTVRMGEATARALMAATGGRLSVSPGPVTGEFVVTASQYVGGVVLPELQVMVRPKVRTENLFLLLDVGMPVDAWSPEMIAYGSDRHLLPALAAFFVRTLDAALARGVLRWYRPEEARVPALRGRVDFPALFRQPGVALPLPCRFEEYTADIAENRYLKAAARRLMLVGGVQPAVRRRLLEQIVRLEEVTDTWPDPDEADRFVFTRLNRHYEPAVRLARLVLRQLTLLDRFGDVGANTFFLDMNALFQEFVTNRLRRSPSFRLEVDPEPTVYLDTGCRVAMAPDLVFRADGRVVYVGDVKYKLIGSGGGRSADYYQLLAYTTALDLDEGVLVYCQAEGEVPPREVAVRHAGKRLLTYPVDLHGRPEQVEASLESLGRWIAQRAGNRPAASASAG